MAHNHTGKQHAAGGRQSTGRREAERGANPANRRAQRRIQSQRQQRRRKLAMLAGAVGFALLIVVVLIAISRPDDDTAVAALPLVDAPARDAAIPQDGHTLGSPDAPVTIVEYADFQCPACGQFARTVEPQLIAEYVQTGQVRLVYHDFPFLDDRAEGNESDLASEAAFCAQDQGAFWAYHDVLYANQSGENQGAFARNRLIEMALRLGLDVESYSTCLDSDTHEAEVQALNDQTREQGIASTPTFVINGKQIVGGNYAALKQEIEAALADR